jgi:transcriptional regulator with XRE-family HTH domain
MQFGDKLRVMRALRNVSQPVLSVKAGVGMSYISLTEAGKMNLKREQVDRIRLVLDWPQEADCILDKLGGVQYAK